MSHFIAFYRCSKCREPIAGLVSNQTLVVYRLDINGLVMINPKEIVLKSSVSILCSQCQDPESFHPLRTSCRVCKKGIALFYSPLGVLVDDPEKGEVVLSVESLLTEYSPIAFCSVECYQKWRKTENEPIFLEFGKVV